MKKTKLLTGLISLPLMSLPFIATSCSIEIVTKKTDFDPQSTYEQSYELEYDLFNITTKFTFPKEVDSTKCTGFQKIEKNFGYWEYALRFPTAPGTFENRQADVSQVFVVYYVDGTSTKFRFSQHVDGRMNFGVAFSDKKVEFI